MTTYDPPPGQGRLEEKSNNGVWSELSFWNSRVETASGWSSAYFATKQATRCISILRARGIEVEPKYFITRGEPK